MGNVEGLDKDSKFCKTCGYHSYCNNYVTCDYILIEGKRRPCKAGVGCTCYTKKKVKSKANKPQKAPLTTEEKKYNASKVWDLRFSG